MTTTETKTAPATAKAEEAKTEAVAEQPTGYKPETDSTPAQQATAKKTGRVVLDLSNKRCLCGCTGECKGRFQPGHDAKLRGKLTRAAIAGVDLTIIIDGKRQDVKPRRFAEIISNDKHDWAAALDKAIEAGAKAAEDAKKRKAEAAKKAEERRAAAAEKGKAKISFEDFAK